MPTDHQWRLAYGFPEYTVAGSPEVPQYPAVNVKSVTVPSLLYEGGGVGTRLLVDLGADPPPLTAWYLNATTISSVELAHSPDDLNWTVVTPDFAVGRDRRVGRRHGMLELAAPLTKRYWRFLVEALDGPVTQLGALLPVPSTSITVLAQNPGPFKYTRAQAATTTGLLGGGEVTNEDGDPFLVFSLDGSVWERREAIGWSVDQLFDVLNGAGMGPILIWQNDGDPTHAYLCRRTDVQGLEVLERWAFGSVEPRFAECIA
jgi:hypothetical protein